MTREEQLVFCKTCNHRTIDHHQGLICNLTGKQADFLNTCPDFNEDKSIREQTINKIEHIRPNQERARLAQIFVWIVLVLDMISIMSSLIQINLLKKVEAGYAITDNMDLINSLLEMSVGATYFLAYIISGILFIRWFRRSYYNLGVRTTTNFTEGWAAGSWFVPIITLFRPYQIMKEMWVKTSAMINKLMVNQTYTSKTGMISLWWALWIISGILGQISFRIGLRSETTDELLRSSEADILQSIITVPLAIITVKMIKAYTKKEEQLNVLERQTFGYLDH